MNAWRMIRSLNPQQRNTFLASFLGWSLDAFDFFLLTFVTQRVAAEFHVGLPAIALALTLTLVFRPLQCLWPELACHVRGGDTARPGGLPDSEGRARVRGLGAPESRTRNQWGRLLAKCVGCGEASSLALSVRDSPDDGVQLDVAW